MGKLLVHERRKTTKQQPGTSDGVESSIVKYKTTKETSE